jgi:hypothetical protein
MGVSRMARGGHGLAKVLLGPSMPYPSILCGWATPETAFRALSWTLLVLQCPRTFSGSVKAKFTSQSNVFVEWTRSPYKTRNISMIYMFIVKQTKSYTTIESVSQAQSSASIRDCVGRSVGPSVSPSVRPHITSKTDYVAIPSRLGIKWCPCFKSRRSASIRDCVGQSVRPSVGRSVHPHITSKTSYVAIASRRGGGRGKLVTLLLFRA